MDWQVALASYHCSGYIFSLERHQTWVSIFQNVAGGTKMAQLMTVLIKFSPKCVILC